ncbi:RICIN domain-containing protein [Streptomyces sp. CC53]|uniref:RICIN domain-containing protein n=1 Tax=Streptomyces sp. CC53 TaxID=1906740 RepID=UPI000AF2F59F|nr:RICIN domain-containing protein [Streptomyces sp. CC53]
MSGRRRLRKAQRRKPRRLILATLAVAMATITGGLTYQALSGDGPAGGADGAPPALAQAAAAPPTVEPEPAAEPARDEKPEPLTEKPKEEPRKGLVYRDLKPAPADDKCAGVYRTESGHCTHGPDAPPPGVDITKDTPPAIKAEAPTGEPGTAPDAEPSSPADSGTPAGGAEDGGSAVAAVPALDAAAATDPSAAPSAEPPAAAASPDGRSASPGSAGSRTAAAGPAGQTVQCDGDGATGNRVQVVYVHAPGKDRYAQYLPSFRKWAADADLIFSESAKVTGGVRHIRYVTAADCTPTVLNIEVPASALAEFSATNRALAAQGLNRRDRKYMIFADAQVYCGIGTFAGDERPGQDNLSNFGPSYGRTDTGCWGGHTAAHELGHNLGAVNNSAPNTSRGAHCTDEYDVMCYSDSPYYPKMRYVCGERSYENLLDCRNDDYFHTNPRRGSYLATHWNIANNRFLMQQRGDGGTTPDPGPKPTPTPTPKPTPTGGTGSHGPDVTVGQIGQDSAVASWRAVPGASWYQLHLNGRHIGWIQGTSARIYNLAAGTRYQVAVAVRYGDGSNSRVGRATSFRTTGGGSGTTPAPETRYLLVNGATGNAAELWGARRGDGTVLVGSQRNGYAHQQWYFDSAGDGTVRIRSGLSGKCLQLGGRASAGMYVAQQPCSAGAAQQWRISASGSGVRIAPASGDRYALAVSNRAYYGSWLIEVQHASDNPAQVWTVQKP